ncbi:MAG: hypothetical protein ABJO14_11920 [Haloferula sp.]|uniref:hypothetical protein n=1 Tax=Haloferula sp. TaxID=2497595 RepID=UPI00329EF545
MALVAFRNSYGDAAPVEGIGQESEGPLSAGDQVGRSDSGRLTDDGIRARVQSLLDVRKGEIGIIRVPAGAFIDGLGLKDGNSVGAFSEPGSPRISGLFSREQSALVLEGALRSGHRLKSVVGEAEGIRMPGSEFSVELLEVVDKGEVTELQIGYSAMSSERSGQTGITVYNGFGLLMLSDSGPEAEGMLVVTGAEEAE